MRSIPKLTAISSRRALPENDLTPWLDALGEARVDAIQIREKDLSDLELYELTRLAVRRTHRRCRVILSGRGDIALAAGADGVHLAADGAPVAAIRRLVGPRLLIGCSTHGLDQIDRARDGGADYVYFSPIYDTPGKAPAVGLDALARAADRGIPVMALGGIRIDRLAAVAEAGAQGAGAIRMFLDPSGLPAVIAAAERYFTR